MPGIINEKHNVNAFSGNMDDLNHEETLRTHTANIPWPELHTHLHENSRQLQQLLHNSISYISSEAFSQANYRCFFKEKFHVHYLYIYLLPTFMEIVQPTFKK